MRSLEAVEWLRGHLGSEIKAVKELKLSAKAAGIGVGGLKLARAVLNCDCFQLVNYGPFYVCMPGVEHTGFEHHGHSRSDSLDDDELASRLMSDWHAARNGSGSLVPGLFEQVEWVAEHLLLSMSALTVSDVPCGSALSLLLWAKSNEADFRSMYDSKRMERVSARAAGKVKGRASEDRGLLQASIDQFKKKGSSEAS